MVLYKLLFTTNGPLTCIPNSQKIFGAVCTVINAVKGPDQLQSYFQSFDEEPFLIHSSMFLNGTMPMIKENIFDIEMVNKMIGSQSPEKKLDVLSNMKIYKKIRTVSDRVFTDYILHDRINDLKQDIFKGNKLTVIDNHLAYAEEKQKFSKSSQSFFRVRKDVMNEESDEGRLFRDKAEYYPKDTEFKIYVKTTLKEEELKEIFSYFHYFSVGNKGSIGRNLFTLQDIIKIDLKSDSERKMVLSAYIPMKNEFEADESSYELNSVNYIANPKRKGSIYTRKISHIAEGSVMKFKTHQDYYGKVISYALGEERQYHYGIGFVV